MIPDNTLKKHEEDGGNSDLDIAKKEKTILRLIAKDLEISNCDSAGMDEEGNVMDRKEIQDKVMSIFVDGHQKRQRIKQFQALFISPYDFDHHKELFETPGMFNEVKN